MMLTILKLTILFCINQLRNIDNKLIRINAVFLTQILLGSEIYAFLQNCNTVVLKLG